MRECDKTKGDEHKDLDMSRRALFTDDDDDDGWCALSTVVAMHSKERRTCDTEYDDGRVNYETGNKRTGSSSAAKLASDTCSKSMTSTAGASGGGGRGTGGATFVKPRPLAQRLAAL